MATVDPVGGLLACVATLVALGAPPRERSAAAVSGLMLLLAWGLYACSWGPNSPAGLLVRAGVEAEHVEMWGLVDMVNMAAIWLMAHDTRWGKALYWLIGAQIALHPFYQFGLIAWTPYETILDALFLCQLAVLLSVGGPNCDDLVRRGNDVLRRFRNAEKAPSA